MEARGAGGGGAGGAGEASRGDFVEVGREAHFLMEGEGHVRSAIPGGGPLSPSGSRPPAGGGVGGSGL